MRTTPILSKLNSLPMRHTIGYFVTMLFHIVSDFPGNDVKSIGISGRVANELHIYLRFNELRSELDSISPVF